MPLRCLVVFTALMLAPAAWGQDDASLQQLAEGWGRGEWILLAHVIRDPETGRWERIEESPWTRWTVQQVGPRSVEYVTADGTARRVDFLDGIYRDGPVGDGSSDEATEAAIVEYGIHAEDNWRILMLWPPFPDAPPGTRDYSELVVAGDVCVWTNWSEGPDGTRQRVMYSVSQLARE